MDSISVDLRGSQIERIELEQDRLAIHFSRAYLIKSMTGSAEQTRWWQPGSLVIEGAEVSSTVPDGPQTCSGGDVEENIYTYRDMIPIPFESRGRVGCTLVFEGTAEPLRATGVAIRLDMLGVPKYIEHIRPA